MSTLVGSALIAAGVVVFLGAATYVLDRWLQSRAKRTGPTGLPPQKEETP